MHATLPFLAFLGLVLALPKIPFTTIDSVISLDPHPINKRQAKPCFVIGTQALPNETVDVANALGPSITCAFDATTIAGVPDVTSGDVTFSQVDFSRSGQSPLGFALSAFSTTPSVADSNLEFLQDALNVYLATEAGIRSVGGNLAIKVPKFFLEMQVSRVQTARGNPPAEAGLQVKHLRDKVLKNAAGEDKALLDQVAALAAQLG